MTPLKWTTDKPTTPGWYWWRGRAVMRIFHVIYQHGLKNKADGLYVKSYGRTLLMGGHWAGPIPLPEEAQP